MKIPNLTPDAAAALERAGLSRRGFLKGSGALVVGFSIAGVAGRFGFEAPLEAQVRQAMNGVLCRCFTHTRMVRAIMKYAQGRNA